MNLVSRQSFDRLCLITWQNLSPVSAMWGSSENVTIYKSGRCPFVLGTLTLHSNLQIWEKINFGYLTPPWCMLFCCGDLTWLIYLSHLKLLESKDQIPLIWISNYGAGDSSNMESKDLLFVVWLIFFLTHKLTLYPWLAWKNILLKTIVLSWALFCNLAFRRLRQEDLSSKAA